MLKLYEKYAQPAILFVMGMASGAEAGARLKQALPATDLNMVQQLCELLALQLRDSGRVQDSQATARSRTRLHHLGFAPLTCCACGPCLHVHFQLDYGPCAADDRCWRLSSFIAASGA